MKMFKKTYFYSGNMHDKDGGRQTFFCGLLRTRLNAIEAMGVHIEKLKSEFPGLEPHYIAFYRCD